MRRAPWGGSTNLRAVFDLILDKAIKSELPKEQMVKTLFIFTDMQFDSCDASDKWESTFDYSKNLFESHGYSLPRIVCWNLRSSVSKSMPIELNTNGYAMLSGFSAELLECILEAKEFTPLSIMTQALAKYDVPVILKTNCTILSPESVNISSLQTATDSSQIKKAFIKLNN